jgi:hypothetical protein
MKVSGSYASLVRGVSQQVPQERGPGQHTEQVNLLPDPVLGLTRRHGTRWQAEVDLSLAYVSGAFVADTDSWRTFEYTSAGSAYVVMMRTAARPVGSTLPAMMVYNRTTKQFLSVVRPAVDATLDLFESGGCSAATPVGKYLFMAGHSIVPAATSVDLWGDATNQGRAAIWVRGGANARTFTVTATKTDNTVYTFSYTTPKAAYQGTLDTTAVALYAADPAGGTQTDTEAAFIDGSTTPSYGTHKLGWAAWAPTTLSVKKGGTTLTNVSPGNPTSSTEYRWDAGASMVFFHTSNIGAIDVSVSYTHTKTVSNPLYAKTVNDIVNTYNSAVTAWIGTSAEAVQPQNIAQSLLAAATAAGLTGGTRSGAHVYFANVKALTVNDGGDGSLIRGVANEVTSIDHVSDMHFIGKVVKVRAKTSAESFYLKATSKDGQAAAGSFAEALWVEGCGKQHTVNSALIYATASGSTMYIASSASLLNSIIAGTHPTFDVSTVGDDDTSPLPYFIGKKITFLDTFQDRLIIGAGSVIRASKTADYLSFFRSTVLALPANDPLEMTAKGGEQDELRFGVVYDRNMVIFGREKQYVIDGRTVLSPTNANMAIMSSHTSAAEIPPVPAGGLIFYGKRGEVNSSVHQIQLGAVTGVPESYLASSQLADYLSGPVIELAVNAKPAVLFIRTKGKRNSLYTFHYLDTPEGRKQDAWSRWDFATDAGTVIGMSQTQEGMLIFSMRASLGTTFVVCDLAPLTSGLSSLPYLDSLRPYSSIGVSSGSIQLDNAAGFAGCFAAFDDTSEWRLLGGQLATAPTLQSTYPLATGLWAGFAYDAAFTPTNPFQRDRQDKAITTGRMVVTSLLASIHESSGFSATLVTKAGTQVIDYNGRRLGDPNNRIGREVVSDIQQTVPIGREVREYTVTLKSRRWLPFTLIALEYVGQFFNRTQRF